MERILKLVEGDRPDGSGANQGDNSDFSDFSDNSDNSDFSDGSEGNQGDGPEGPEKQRGRYGRFYSLMGRMPYADKEALVCQFTNGRTTHLHLMGKAEYDVMCSEMERVAGYPERIAAARAELKKARSGALRQMTLWGVDTKDWQKVNYFCENKRIAGKEFRLLKTEELLRLNRKLRAMIRKREQANINNNNLKKKENGKDKSDRTDNGDNSDNSDNSDNPDGSGGNRGAGGHRDDEQGGEGCTARPAAERGAD